MATGLLTALIATGVAWADGPGGVIDDAANGASEAVGTGVFDNGLVGFRASGNTNEEASAAVIAACRRAGGRDCTSDEVTNENLCVVSVADPVSRVVAGGAGVTLDVARQDAIARAAANSTPLGPGAVVVVSACP
jgi:hypothetical protein